ncbi:MULTISPECIES: hypothetical protein [unclassified Paenibacillus]|uniref:hypothetical protein n=1 Tax=unclassified Paenibacillus TaxID=185978 RepID=UPI001AE8A01F|nr:MULTISPECIES: hypothetical protein [unclassified Paenibacillus]MBP1154820.1 hypothetical protein [Paenibacillus sp. PvP091]MBP1169796.1 hypothetical protein [Paenibacillus sp. PvR098]MBP2440824.1 hypothetical protein [Paenibacillus sp. PvP052]
MISDEQLNTYRLESTLLRVVRDADSANDVKGIVVAWDDSTVMIRKPNRRLVKLDRNYRFQPFAEPRTSLFSIEDE